MNTLEERLKVLGGEASTGMKEVAAWTKYEWGAAIQADILIFKAENGFIARASRAQEVFVRGSTISEASEKAKLAFEDFVLKSGSRIAPPGDPVDEPYVERHMYIIERNPEFIQAMHLVERIDSVLGDEMMSPEEVDAYNRASTLPILQRKPKAVQEQ